MNAIPTSPDEAHKPAELTGRQALLQEIGCKLSQSRSASGESIEEAVRKLKIRKSHLQALENGDWQKMPDDVYVLGFLRQYSQYLEVDLSDETHRLKNDQYALTKPLTFPDPPVAPSRRWAWIAGAAFVLLFLLFNITIENNNMDHQLIAESPEPAATTETTPDTADSKPSTHHSGAVSDAIESVGLDTSAETATKTPPAKQISGDSITPAISAMDTPVTAMPVAKKLAPAMHHFRFDAVGSPVWLQISRPDESGIGKGRLMKEVLLQTGFHTTIHAPIKSLWITCGNAPALRISVDGSVFAAPGSLGIGKKVLRDYRFSIVDDHSVSDNSLP